jgi:hypothetical protein
MKSPKTGRTPRSEAGCNKPAALEREKPVEVVRNGEDGTRGIIGMIRPKVHGWETVCVLGEDRTK